MIKEINKVEIEGNFLNQVQAIYKLSPGSSRSFIPPKKITYTCYHVARSGIVQCLGLDE